MTDKKCETCTTDACMQECKEKKAGMTCTDGKCADGLCKDGKCEKKCACPCGKENCNCKAKIGKIVIFAVGIILGALIF